MTTPKIFFCGDMHGGFDHIIAAVERERPDAVVLLGDIQAQRPLEIELAPILDMTSIFPLPGNHDSDSALDYANLFESKLAPFNLHARVTEVAGVRIAGLGGIFRSKVWMPPGKPQFETYDQWLKAALDRQRSGDDTASKQRAAEDERREQRTTIFPADVRALKKLRADLLVTHEAPSSHPLGFAVIDEIAQAMAVHTAFHGHQHDRIDYQAQWPRLRFKAFGVGFRGITDLDGRVVRAGDFDTSRPRNR